MENSNSPEIQTVDLSHPNFNFIDECALVNMEDLLRENVNCNSAVPPILHTNLRKHSRFYPLQSKSNAIDLFQK